MARRTHSEQWWATAPLGIMRCQGTYKGSGLQCRRESEPGSAVCDQHGGAARQVQRRAAERMRLTADQMLETLLGFVNDPAVPYGVRAKIAQDMLDRAGLAATQVHKVVPAVEDPVESLFKSILNDPDGLVGPASGPPALPAGAVVPGQVVDAAQEAIDRLEESWQPDADALTLEPAGFGKVGPHDYRGKTEVENGDPRPAPPVPGWRAPDDIA